MTEITDPNPQQTDPNPLIDLREMYLDVDATYDSRSHAGKEQIAAIGALAAEYGLTLDDITANPEEESQVPAGFTSAETIPGYRAQVHLTQFNGVLKPFEGRNEAVSTDVTELVTDTGKTVRLIDLRPFMTSAIRSGGPKAEAEKAGLDQSMLRDLKLYAEGTPRNRVTGAKGVLYSKLGNTKVRAYWLPVRDEMNSDNVLTVARIGDCANGTSKEEDLYRQLFGMTVHM